MIKQADIKITDLHPEYNPKSGTRQGLNKQDEFLFKIHSSPLMCPLCGQSHTVNELRINSPKYRVGQLRNEQVIELPIFCPETNIELHHAMGIFAGDEWLTVKKQAEPPLTFDIVSKHPVALELYQHIHAEKGNGLVGSQWVTMEFIWITNKFNAKILGSDKENKPVSAPIEHFRERQYCGIHYHMEDWCKKRETLDDVNKLMHQTMFQYAFYNPYQNKVIICIPFKP